MTDSAKWTEALFDYLNGDHSATIIQYDPDGTSAEFHVAMLFREPTMFYPGEIEALELCKGRVLEVGAGAGSHALALQERGIEVCAIDIESDLVETMRCRGVKNARCIDFFDLKDGPFDTILTLENGIGFVGKIEMLSTFFDKASRLLAPGGKVLTDLSFMMSEKNSIDLNQNRALPKFDRYVVTKKLQYEYKGKKSSAFEWLFIDPESLIEYAMRAGWHASVAWRNESGRCIISLNTH